MQLILFKCFRFILVVFCICSIFISCHKPYNFEVLSEGKYKLVCIIHNTFTNQTDTIQRMCIGPHSQSYKFWFSIYQETNEDYYKCWIEESDNDSNLSFYHRNPLLSFDAYYSDLEFKKDTLNLSFSSNNDSLIGTLNLIRVP